ncbi:lysophospholipase L1-like esterase [Desulfobaculum xiamenense]|uniref:Lysophospholipase L1-like esterase n=1 Tax=Desulfobaculum xiamenense TaxID=995050 RepID=A0A846QTA5_9BACT|nr:GDSL-type esterase/lipase family protein [Desulfobaculum xiamenense]NJB68695.1 lysophospholipase L1-like esterase [Desulfobaculum xiamenense]
MSEGKARKALGAALLVLASVFVAVAGVEVYLRVTGFSCEPYLSQVQFGWPHPKAIREAYVIDDDLFWITKKYRGQFDEARRNPPRIVFVGDSCTQIGSYDRQFAQLVESERPGMAVPFLNAGVAGWSSYQGLRQLERDVLGLDPDVVTIYFGWNDHWASFGIEDKDVASVLLPFGLSHLRVVQLFIKVRAVGLVEPGKITLARNRVPEEDYRANLERMVTLCREHGIRPVLLTAPSSHERGQEPEYLKRRWLHSLDDLVPMHRRYNDIVRQVAAQTGTPLCDLERVFDALPREEVRTAHFRKDGIHLNPSGDRIIAQALYETMRENGLVEHVLRPATTRNADGGGGGGA